MRGRCLPILDFAHIFQMGWTLRFHQNKLTRIGGCCRLAQAVGWSNLWQTHHWSSQSWVFVFSLNGISCGIFFGPICTLNKKRRVKLNPQTKQRLGRGFKYYFLFSYLPGVKWSHLTSIFFRWVESNPQLEEHRQLEDHFFWYALKHGKNPYLRLSYYFIVFLL